ncbi:PREDICTED: uncharacterized protein LOC105448080 [Wasmannia auropunctata]|uniref:uncharacterized protein LOC105448080 n=1 Tax=Wasmannia auropunctata TaxID=64793 RepID=UPI0005F07801|nr:PREDICTED: uncharacterized protein LOC105448080 [Wasmannia auropunctata]
MGHLGHFPMGHDPYRNIPMGICGRDRIVSYQAAFLLARVIPVDFLAKKYMKVFTDTRAVQAEEIRVTYWIRERIRKMALDRALNRWKEDYARSGTTAVEIRRILVLQYWYKHIHGYLTYRMTQVMTGHGYFNDYLYRIGKAPGRDCSHCDDPCDFNYYTLGVLHGP